MMLEVLIKGPIRSRRWQQHAFEVDQGSWPCWSCCRQRLKELLYVRYMTHGWACEDHCDPHYGNSLSNLPDLMIDLLYVLLCTAGL